TWVDATALGVRRLAARPVPVEGLRCHPDRWLNTLQVASARPRRLGRSRRPLARRRAGEALGRTAAAKRRLHGARLGRPLRGLPLVGLAPGRAPPDEGDRARRR